MQRHGNRTRLDGHYVGAHGLTGKKGTLYGIVSTVAVAANVYLGVETDRIGRNAGINTGDECREDLGCGKGEGLPDLVVPGAG